MGSGQGCAQGYACHSRRAFQPGGWRTVREIGRSRGCVKNESTKSAAGTRRSSTRWARRCVSMRVLPEPGPAMTISGEQQVSSDLGLFARADWADGNVEPYEFTDADRTVAAGLSLSGQRWGRPHDTFGLAGIVNGISGIHAAYLNAGGLGILVGDGQLPHPGSEKIVEALYSFPIGSWLATFDYQLVANPGYNRDRGPVSTIGTRLHAQF